MKRKLLFISCLLISLTALTSCSAVEKVLKLTSGLADTEEYQAYSDYLKENGFYESYELFNEKNELGGLYVDNCSGENKKEGSVHVSFSVNNSLTVTYFCNEQLTDEIQNLSCDVNAGDWIYASVEKNSENISSSSYDFSRIKIYEIDTEKQTRKEITDFAQKYDNGVLSFEIPSGISSNVLSVVPVGEYKTKTIRVEDYSVDKNDNKENISGMWYVNEKESSSSTIDISPIEPYIISYKYDTSKYFFLNSEPDCFYNNESEGIIIFKQCYPEDEAVDYKIELSEYLDLKLEVDVSRKVWINNGKETNYDSGDTINISNLKYGEIITIATNTKWEKLEDNKDFVYLSSERGANNDVKQFIYKLQVPEKEGSFTFNPSNYKYEHGKIIFKCLGKTIYSTQVIPKGRKIYYEELVHDEGYYLPGKDEENYIVVESEESTIEALKNIKFNRNRVVTVDLPQPEYGGQVCYLVDGNEIKSDSFKCDVGQEIIVNFEPQEGWINDVLCKDGYIYKVEDQDDQTVFVKSADRKVEVNDYFKEDAGHKPKLNVVLEQTLGEKFKFRFDAPGLTDNDYNYEDGWFRTEYTIIKENRIGTETPMKIIASDKAMESGKALRISIEKTDSKKNTYKEVICYDDLTKDIPDITVYDELYNSKTSSWCKNINIRIGLVDAGYFKSPQKQEGLVTEVFDANTGLLIKENEVIDYDRQIKVILKTEDGYQFGKDGKTSYTEKLKYSDYLKKIDSLMKKHNPTKICSLTLDNSEPISYAVYYLDGKEVINLAEAYEGQELRIEYRIINSDYKIHKSSVSMDILNWSDKKIIKTIKVTKDMDGQTIDKENFNIIVEKR